jgi:hypothetical protein
MPEPEITDLHLWIDFETSGLEIGRDRVLEVAWCFTDADLKMLTPLRQRLACIEPPDWPRTSFVDRGARFDPKKDSSWNDPDFFDQRGVHGLVQKMHEDNKLRRDHFVAPPEMVLTDAAHFERLYLDDLYTAKQHFEEDKFQVVISGAGVSHMDVYMLADLLPDRFPLMPPPDGSSGMAYWQFDTSVAGRVLGAGVMERLREWLKDPECPFDLVACERSENLWNELPGLIKTKRVHGGLMAEGQADLVSEFDLTGAVAHRAAADVVFSLVDARLMRKITDAPNLLTSQL